MRATSLSIAIGALSGAVVFSGCSGSEGSDGSGGAAGAAGASGGASSGGASTGGSSGSGGNSSGGKSGTGGNGGTSAGSSGSSGMGGSGGEGGGAPCGCVEQTISWNQDGGFVAYRESNTLEPCHALTIVREPVGTDPPSLMCMDPIDSCDGIVDSGDIQAALGHSDVEAALAASPILFGRDTRPVDGQVFQIHVGGQLIEIGAVCNGAADCTDEPSGVLTLRTYLQSLASQIRTRPPCSDVL